ncbi:cupin domain-containing protein [Nocardioides sp. MH1]|uniref:AraC family transcriptional regulator n=1 Tax=Nocardioides sp. MH1 TaxID=3242490 RepID=UPI003522F2E9
MDALGALLSGPRAQDAFLLRAVLEPPWSIRIEDEAPLTVVTMVSGTAWLAPEGGEPTSLGPGDVLVALGPEPYTMADSPDTPVQTIIHPDQRCTTLYGEELADKLSLGVRSWGNGADGGTVMLIGTYQLAGEVSRRLLAALPRCLVLHADEWDCPVTGLLTSEIGRDEPGQEAVLDRMLDLLLISALRAWFARPGTAAPSWYRANADPVVGRALRLIHNNPEHPWTVAELAATTGLSRAALARRFAALVGEPPMAYLTGWRIALAADLLHEPGATLESVARQVGYSTPFALSTAFKRIRGVSPAEHRRAS